MINKELHKNHLIMGVGVILLREGKILLGRRKGPRNPGEFGLPGGFIESIESVETAAYREVSEETALEQVKLNPAAPVRWSDGEHHYFDLIFYGYCNDGTPIVNEAHRSETWRWFSYGDLPSPLYEPTKLALQRFMHDQKSRKASLLLRKLLFRYGRILWFED